MIDINTKACIYEGCKVLASYNFEWDTQLLYCFTHKKEGMINVKSKKCIQECCKTLATYNFTGEIISLYCSKHKKEGMIDIKHKICKGGFCLGTLANPKYKGYCST